MEDRGQPKLFLRFKHHDGFQGNVVTGCGRGPCAVPVVLRMKINTSCPLG